MTEGGWRGRKLEDRYRFLILDGLSVPTRMVYDRRRIWPLGAFTNTKSCERIIHKRYRTERRAGLNGERGGRDDRRPAPYGQLRPGVDENRRCGAYEELIERADALPSLGHDGGHNVVELIGRELGVERQTQTGPSQLLSHGQVAIREASTAKRPLEVDRNRVVQ